MNKQQIFPTIMVVLSVFSALGYIGEDTRKVIYWIAAAVLTSSVTY
jgi:hypothetical protein